MVDAANVSIGYNIQQWHSGTLRECVCHYGKQRLTEGSCCPAVSGEPRYLPLWCSSRGCQRTAWSLERPTPLAGLVTRTRVSSHCYGGSMHPKVRRGGWESEREGGRRATKCSNLKRKAAKKQNVQRKMLKCSELLMLGITQYTPSDLCRGTREHLICKNIKRVVYR